MGNAVLYIKASGTAQSLSELGEQFAWLTSVRSSMTPSPPLPQGKYRCYVPMIKSEYNSGKYEKICRINAEHSVRSLEEVHDRGECWMNFFGNRALILGYPTPRRPDRIPGLEMALSTISRLLNTQYVTTLGDSIFVAGLSAMLVLQNQYELDRINHWHLVHDLSGTTSGYDLAQSHACRFGDVSSIMEAGFQNSRQIIGWCSRVYDESGKIFGANFAMACY
jgi:hypothetical protein